jgi:hypothetical protein
MKYRPLYAPTFGTHDRPFLKRPGMVWRLPFEGSHLAGNCAAFVAINSMKEHVDQQIKSENAKRNEYRRRHGSLNRTGTGPAAASLKIGTKAPRSLEDFIKILSRKLASGTRVTFYVFLMKRAGFARNLFPTICVCRQGARVPLKPFCRDHSSNRDEYSPQIRHSRQVIPMWLRLQGPCRVGRAAAERF